MACSASASSIRSGSSGTRVEQCSRARTTGISMSRAGTSEKNAPWFGKAGENSTVWDSASPKFIMGGSDEEKFDQGGSHRREVLEPTPAPSQSPPRSFYGS